MRQLHQQQLQEQLQHALEEVEAETNETTTKKERGYTEEQDEAILMLLRKGEFSPTKIKRLCPHILANKSPPQIYAHIKTLMKRHNITPAPGSNHAPRRRRRAQKQEEAELIASAAAVTATTYGSENGSEANSMVGDEEASFEEDDEIEDSSSQEGKRRLQQQLQQQHKVPTLLNGIRMTHPSNNSNSHNFHHQQEQRQHKRGFEDDSSALTLQQKKFVKKYRYADSSGRQQAQQLQHSTAPTTAAFHRIVDLQASTALEHGGGATSDDEDWNVAQRLMKHTKVELIQLLLQTSKASSAAAALMGATGRGLSSNHGNNSSNGSSNNSSNMDLFASLAMSDQVGYLSDQVIGTWQMHFTSIIERGSATTTTTTTSNGGNVEEEEDDDANDEPEEQAVRNNSNNSDNGSKQYYLHISQGSPSMNFDLEFDLPNVDRAKSTTSHVRLLRNESTSLPSFKDLASGRRLASSSSILLSQRIEFKFRGYHPATTTTSTAHISNENGNCNHAICRRRSEVGTGWVSAITTATGQCSLKGVIDTANQRIRFTAVRVHNTATTTAFTTGNDSSNNKGQMVYDDNDELLVEYNNYIKNAAVTVTKEQHTIATPPAAAVANDNSRNNQQETCNYKVEVEQGAEHKPPMVVAAGHPAISVMRWR